MFKFARQAMPIVVLLATGQLVGCGQKSSVSEEETATLIQPVGRVEFAGAAPAATASAASATPLSGEKIVQTVCGACHTAGAAGAPKLDDKGAWTPRVAQGTAALYANAINGKNAMPARGGAANLSDAEIKSAVDHMLSLVK